MPPRCSSACRALAWQSFLQDTCRWFCSAVLGCFQEGRAGPAVLAALRCHGWDPCPVVTWGWACTTRAGGGAVCASTQVPTSAARISCPGLCRWTKPTAIPSPPLCPPPPWAVGVSTHPQTGEAQGGAQHQQPLFVSPIPMLCPLEPHLAHREPHPCSLCCSSAGLLTLPCACTHSKPSAPQHWFQTAKLGDGAVTN